MIAVIEQGLLVTVRYSIILFPLAIVLASLAINDFFNPDDSRENNKAKLVFCAVLVMVAILCVATQIQQNYFHGKARKRFMDRVYKKLVYPLITLGVSEREPLLYRYFPWKSSERPQRWLCRVLVALNVFSILLISPFYFSYTNDLLPKTYIINGAWGYGGYEAAQYMNNLPNAKT